MERWLPVPGYEGLYQVSDLGRVASLPRQTARGVRGGKILKPGLDTHGYPYVNLSRRNKVVKFFVHYLVLAAFDRPKPRGMEARHGPGGKLDASLANLCWGTRADNVGPDRRRDGQDNGGERNGQHKLTWEQVHEIRRGVAAGRQQVYYARLYGVSKGAVWDIVHRRNWRNLT